MNCRLCGHDTLELCYTQGNHDEFRFYRCPVCRLVNYDLAGGLDQAKYAREYVDPDDDTVRSNVAQSITYRFLKAHLPAGGRMLEIGCGNGRLLKEARADGWEVEGLELSSFLAQSVTQRLGIPVRVGNFLTDEAGEAAAYDVVLLRHVLEHLPDSQGAMRRVHALLKPGGHAHLEFPNIDAWDLRFKRWMRAYHLHRKRYPDDYHPGHCNEFCRPAFEVLAERTGFALALWQTYSYKPLQNAVFSRLHVGNKARVLARKQA